jgi:hypothetical protein
MEGEELARIATNILESAETIDWGSEYILRGNKDEGNVNEVITESTTEDSQQRRTGGSWRLLMDQKNQAQWSPLHLVFVQGGISSGKVALVRALLQKNDRDTNDAETRRHRQRLLQQVDRQNRTMLHHNCETRGPREDNFDAAHYLINECPSMLFVRDTRGYTPAEYVLHRLREEVVTQSASLTDEEDSRRSSYRMLKLLIAGMEREERRVVEGAEIAKEMADDTGVSHVITDNEITTANDVGTTATPMAITKDFNQTNIISANNSEPDSNQNESALTTVMRNIPQHEIEPVHPITTNNTMTVRNVLHSSCRLSKNSCLNDGSLILFLASPQASKLEYGKKSLKRLAEGQDDEGNYALHIFLSNESYGNTQKEVSVHNNGVNATNLGRSSVEYRIVKRLIEAHPSAIFTANNNGMLPLQLAIDTGLRNVIPLLVQEYPQAVLLDSRLENIKMFTKMLGCISMALKDKITSTASEDAMTESINENENVDSSEQRKLFSTMYFLVRSRPDVVALGGAASLSNGVTKKQLDIQPNLFRRIVKFWKRQTDRK